MDLLTENREAVVGETVLITDSKSSRYDTGDTFQVKDKVWHFVQAYSAKWGDTILIYRTDYEVVVGGVYE